MTIRKTLFDSSADFLSHTLENATRNIEQRSAQLADGASIILHALGILEIAPVQSETATHPPKLILSAGIHGNETAPIEFCNTLINEIINGEYSVKTPTLFIFGNPEAMVIGERFIEHNMNRLFCGTHANQTYCDSVDGQRAALIEQSVANFIEDTNGEDKSKVNHYDLHTAIRDSVIEKFAIYPYIPGRSANPMQLQFLAFSDVSAFLFQTSSATTFSSHTAVSYGAESFTVELGKVKPFGQNDLERYNALTENLRTRLKGGWPTPRSAEHRVQCFIASHEIINTGNNFALHIPENISNFTKFPVGSLIWEDKEQSYRVQGQEEYIVFPNSKVGPGQRAGLMLRLVDMGATPKGAEQSTLH